MSSPRRTRPAGPTIRSLNPVDPSKPPPDGGHLLATVLTTAQPPRRHRGGNQVLRLAPLAFVLAGLVGVAAAVLVGGGERGDEQEATSGSVGAAIVHYVVRESVAMTGRTPQLDATREYWQLEDGSRARTISRWEGTGPLEGATTENVVTSRQTLAYEPASDGKPATIIRYRSSDDFRAVHEAPPSFTAPPIGGSRDIGDPRGVPSRLANGDKHVTQLTDSTVRGIKVKRYRVGACRRESPQSTGNPNGLTGHSQQAIVALAGQALTPVRVVYEPCSGGGPKGPERILDYLAFEELAPTPDNLKLLELSRYPGVPVVDGIDIDKAEERDDGGARPQATPTPSAKPAP